MIGLCLCIVGCVIHWHFQHRRLRDEPPGGVRNRRDWPRWGWPPRGARKKRDQWGVDMQVSPSPRPPQPAATAAATIPQRRQRPDDLHAAVLLPRRVRH